MQGIKPRVIFIVGPTAVGKTEVAVKVAKKINAEIISCDSMQVYKWMDILTSKPSPALRKKIPHHLIDVVLPTKQYNVSSYQKEALSEIGNIITRGKLPLFVGGTGLYMSVLIDGIFDLKAENPVLRKHLYRQAEKRGSNWLYAKLKKIDPLAAGKIHPNDTRRIVRALEVFKETGKPISFLQKQRRGLADEYDIKIFCLNLARQKLNKRIEQRVDKMFKAGLIKEVKSLLKKKLSRTASYAIGIGELKGYFDGAYDLEEARRLMKKNTRLYAKRQLTWFRKDKRIKWINISERDKPETIAGTVLERLKNRPRTTQEPSLWKERC